MNKTSPPHQSSRFRSAATAFAVLIAGILHAGAASQPDGTDRTRWGDLGDGTYANPVLPADFSDLDAIRVGDDFFAMSSTFQFSPGVVILKSKDLVNWKIIGHAAEDIRQIGPEMNWDRMGRYGKGVWAGSIRFHAGRFWIYFGTPDEGYFMTTAKDPAGPWEPLTQVLKGPGWDDCCPFWDDDGQGYLVGSNFTQDPANGKKYNIHLWKLTPDGKSLVPGSDGIIHQSSGSEANKLYKINGTYYHYYSEVKPEGRVVMMNRSKSLDGPWEKKQLNHSGGKIDPNQGGLIELPDKSWWFFTHFGSGQWPGRVANLLPVKWVDGWPIIGEPGADGIGNMVWQAKKPVPGQPASPRVFREDFAGPKLAPEWEWNYHPRDDKWSLTERPGFLRLHAFKPLQGANILKVGNQLTTRIYQSGRGEVTAKLDVSGMADGQAAGLCLFSRSFGWIGATRADGATHVTYSQNGKQIQGDALTGKDLWLRATITPDGRVTWAFSTDGKAFAAFGAEHQCDWANYRGTRIGLFTYNEAGNGFVDVDEFSYAF